MQHNRGLIVAETGENGNVVHVWVRDEDMRVSHPWRPSQYDLNIDPKNFDIEGAPRSEVENWLIARQQQSFRTQAVDTATVAAHQRVLAEAVRYE